MCNALMYIYFNDVWKLSCKMKLYCLQKTQMHYG